jgi:tetrapyrrole methylase family protein/MazG family protein
MNTDDLFELVKILRERCPWDKSQTLQSLKNKIIEESYELVAAISEDRLGAVIEEIGDVMFLALFLTRILEEEGKTNLDDLVKSTMSKYRAKHPHVFHGKDLKDEHEVLEFWHKSKEDIFVGIPEILPALLAANVIQERAAKLGFDWTTVSGPLEKVREEIAEIEKSGDSARFEELGDLLFACVNLARHLEIDPEDALRSANKKFVQRFRKVIKELRKQGKDIDETNLADMDAIWDDIKKEE